MRPFHKKYHALALPVTGHCYLPGIPSRTNIVAVGCEKERKLDVVLAAIRSHYGIVIIGRVVDAANPRCGQRRLLALVVGEHGTRQRHPILIVLRAHGKLPGTAEVNDGRCVT